MKYVVKLDYKSFIFHDRNEALDFADMAADAAEKPINVSIEVEREVVYHE